MNFEQFHVAVEVVLTVFLPLFLLALNRVIDKAAEKRASVVKQALEEHEEHDEQRFQDAARQLDRMDTLRDGQHVENQKILTKLSTDLDWLKKRA